MKERTSADISIMRNGAVLLTVPITSSSKRKFSLMKEDNITLEFTLPKEMVYSPEIGDYIDDEIFGRFIICEKQQATYEARVGGWKYSLVFKAYYWIFNNKEFMLITTLVNGRKFRKESTWTLTNNLGAQIQAFKDNIESLGYEGWSYQILTSATKQNEVRMVSYNATHIIDALNNICEQWECEWWVRGKVFYIGKCEEDGDNYIDFTEGENVESMTINKDENTFYNRLYCYGSKDNIPYSYGKSIRLAVSEIRDYEGLTYYIPNKEIKPEYFVTKENEIIQISVGGYDETFGETNGRLYKQYFAKSEDVVVDSVKSFKLKIDTKVTTKYYGNYKINNIGFTRYFTLRLYRNGELYRIFTTSEYDVKLDYTLDFKNYMDYDSPWEEYTGRVKIAVDENIRLEPATYHFEFTYKLTLDHGLSFVYENQGLGASEFSVTNEGNGITMEQLTSETPPLDISYSVNGEERKARVKLNPKAICEQRYPDVQYGLVFIDENGNFITNDSFCTESEPIEGKTSQFVLDDGGSISFPEAYYSEDYEDPSSLLRLGELRLRLPKEVSSEEFEMHGNEIWTKEHDFVCRNGYIEEAGILNEDSAVEGVVAFEKVYPDGKMIVSDEPKEVLKKYVDKYYDGSNRTYDFVEYTLKLTLADGTPFTFKEEYRLDDTQLQLRFISPDDIGELFVGEGGKMNGMTFEVRFNEIRNAEEGLDSNTFTIVRNDGFGAKLPNDIIRPYYGDPCVLVGWKVKALRGMGLIDKAELELLRKGVGYMREMRNNQCTVTCKMMSDFSFVMTYQQLYTNEELPFYTSEDLPFMVRDGENVYLLLTEGTKVRVNNDSLRDSMMESRIIGYEMCLDMPFDSPTYIIGETQAYSRLAKIEKEITKIG